MTMTTELYTAAEARQIDIERGGEGLIKLYGHINSRETYFNNHDRLWHFKDNNEVNTIYPDENNEIIWAPVTASLDASIPEPEAEKVWSDKSALEERYEALEKEGRDLLDKYIVRGFKIEQLEKELAEYKNNYHEILADHGELTQKFDELKENQRWKSCKDEKPENMFEAMLEGRTIKTWRGIAKQLEKELAEREKTINIQKQTISNREQELDKLKWKQRRKSCKGEKPTTNQKIIFLDGNSMLQRGQYIPLHSQWYLHVGEDHYIALASSTVENWTWKYEADL